jgi:hypothetical protein
VRGICTPGSAWGDEIKGSCLLGEAPARKRERAREAPHGLPSSRLVSTILLDLWFEKKIRPACQGEAYLTRFADGTPVQTSN